MRWIYLHTNKMICLFLHRELNLAWWFNTLGHRASSTFFPFLKINLVRQQFHICIWTMLTIFYSQSLLSFSHPYQHPLPLLLTSSFPRLKRLLVWFWDPFKYEALLCDPWDHQCVCNWRPWPSCSPNLSVGNSSAQWALVLPLSTLTVDWHLLIQSQCGHPPMLRVPCYNCCVCPGDGISEPFACRTVFLPPISEVDQFFDLTIVTAQTRMSHE